MAPGTEARPLDRSLCASPPTPPTTKHTPRASSSRPRATRCSSRRSCCCRPRPRCPQTPPSPSTTCWTTDQEEGRYLLLDSKHTSLPSPSLRLRRGPRRRDVRRSSGADGGSGLHDGARVLWREVPIQQCDRTRVPIVHHQRDSLRRGEVFFHQAAHAFCLSRAGMVGGSVDAPDPVAPTRHHGEPGVHAPQAVNRPAVTIRPRATAASCAARRPTPAQSRPITTETTSSRLTDEPPHWF